MHHGESGTHHTPGHTTHRETPHGVGDTHARVKGGPGQAPLGAAGVHRGALGCTAAPRSAQRRAALFRECRDLFRGRSVVSARGGLCGERTVGALKKGWEKLQVSRGFGVWKGLMREGRKLRAAGWKWFEPKEGGFFAVEDLEAGYVRNNYY